MWLRSLRLVFVAVLVGMALACLAFLWRSDDQYIKQLNYDDSKVHSSVCVCVCVWELGGRKED